MSQGYIRKSAVLLHVSEKTVKTNDFNEFPEGEALFVFDFFKKLQFDVSITVIEHFLGLLSFDYTLIILKKLEKSSENAQTKCCRFVQFA